MFAGEHQGCLSQASFCNHRGRSLLAIRKNIGLSQFHIGVLFYAWKDRSFFYTVYAHTTQLTKLQLFSLLTVLSYYHHSFQCFAFHLIFIAFSMHHNLRGFLKKCKKFFLYCCYIYLLMIIYALVVMTVLIQTLMDTIS